MQDGTVEPAERHADRRLFKRRVGTTGAFQVGGRQAIPFAVLAGPAGAKNADQEQTRRPDVAAPEQDTVGK